MTVRRYPADRAGNLVVAVLLLALAVTMFAATADMPSPGSASDPGAAGYPRLLAVGIGLLALALLAQRDHWQEGPGRDGVLRVVAITVLTILYVNVLAALGYLLATVLFLLATMLVAGARSPAALLLIPPVFSALVYYLFFAVFEVSLPRGALELLIS